MAKKRRRISSSSEDEGEKTGARVWKKVPLSSESEDDVQMRQRLLSELSSRPEGPKAGRKGHYLEVGPRRGP